MQETGTAAYTNILTALQDGDDSTMPSAEDIENMPQFYGGMGCAAAADAMSEEDAGAACKEASASIRAWAEGLEADGTIPDANTIAPPPEFYHPKGDLSQPVNLGDFHCFGYIPESYAPTCDSSFSFLCKAYTAV